MAWCRKSGAQVAGKLENPTITIGMAMVPWNMLPSQGEKKVGARKPASGTQGPALAAQNSALGVLWLWGTSTRTYWEADAETRCNRDWRPPPAPCSSTHRQQRVSFGVEGDQRGTG